jgi:DNA-binding response OmpR family regulator
VSTLVGRTVVILDPDLDGAGALQDDLAAHGCRVLTTSSPVVARRLTRRFHPQAVLVDVPAMDERAVGQASVTELARLCQSLHTRLIAMVGRQRLLMHVEVAEPDGVLIKPFSREALLEAIGSLGQQR